MNGYETLAQEYEEYLKTGIPEETKEDLRRKISALRTVAGKDEKETAALFDTGAFNQICMGYLKKALDNCGIREEQKAGIMSELHWLFDTMSAAEAQKAGGEA